MKRTIALPVVIALCIAAPGAAAQIILGDRRDINDLRTLVETPAVSGYETAASGQIREQLASLHPVVDNLGDVIVTIGSGAPHRLIAAPFDEPGYVVSAITSGGYLRLRRLPRGILPPAFNEQYAAQPVKIGTANGKWLDGVVAGLSIHLQPGRVAPPDPRDIDNMYVDIGASSAAEARAAGVDLLSPVVIDRRYAELSNTAASATSVGDKFGAAALLSILQGIDPAKVTGTLTFAFVTQEWSGGRGLHRILATTRCDEFLYVGRMLSSASVYGGPTPPVLPHQKPGGGVLIGLENPNASPQGVAADLKNLAQSHELTLSTDYSARPIDPSSDPPIEYPANWAHIGIATGWPNTPVETIDLADFQALVDLLSMGLGLAQQSQQRSTTMRLGLAANPDVLERLVTTYGASNHESAVRETVKTFLPPWAKPETDDAGNLILQVGTAPASAKTPKILVIAHMDEIGFEVKSIDAEGRLEVSALGGMYLNFFDAHPAVVHTASGDRDAIMLPLDRWDQPDFKWPSSATATLKVEVGARNLDDVSKLGIKVGDSLTIPKEYHALLGARANARSFDDRLGDTALLAAVRTLGGPLNDRNVTFVWSTGEELGLDGARALAQRLAKEGREPDYVFAVDTFVSADSPLESQRFADAVLGKGFVIRALDSSNIVPKKSVDRLLGLARVNQIPVQFGVTDGGNDGSEFVPFGAIDVAISWPLRYAHSPGEVIDRRDADALARIITVITKSW